MNNTILINGICAIEDNITYYTSGAFNGVIQADYNTGKAIERDANGKRIKAKARVEWDKDECGRINRVKSITIANNAFTIA